MQLIDLQSKDADFEMLCDINNLKEQWKGDISYE